MCVFPSDNGFRKKARTSRVQAKHSKYYRLPNMPCKQLLPFVISHSGQQWRLQTLPRMAQTVSRKSCLHNALCGTHNTYCTATPVAMLLAGTHTWVIWGEKTGFIWGRGSLGAVLNEVVLPHARSMQPRFPSLLQILFAFIQHCLCEGLNLCLKRKKTSHCSAQSSL